MLQGTFCRPKQGRNQISSTDCPEKSSGVALRECSDNGWGRPQLGGCISNWIQEISAHYKYEISVKLLSNNLKHKIC